MQVTSSDVIKVTKTESNYMRQAGYLVRRFGKLAGAVEKIDEADRKRVAECETTLKWIADRFGHPEEPAAP